MWCAGMVGGSASYPKLYIARVLRARLRERGWDDGLDPREDGFDWYTDNLEPEDADEQDDLDDEDDGYVLVDID